MLYLSTRMLELGWRNWQKSTVSLSDTSNGHWVCYFSSSLLLRLLWKELAVMVWLL